MRQTTLFYVAAGLFFLTAVVNFFADDTAQGAVFTALGAAFIAIGSSYRDKLTSTTPIELSETQQLEVQTLVAKGKKVEAVKLKPSNGSEKKPARDFGQPRSTLTSSSLKQSKEGVFVFSALKFTTSRPSRQTLDA